MTVRPGAGRPKYFDAKAIEDLQAAVQSFPRDKKRAADDFDVDLLVKKIKGEKNAREGIVDARQKASRKVLAEIKTHLPPPKKAEVQTLRRWQASQDYLNVIVL